MVTGAAGFIGSHLSDALVRGGHEVVGVDAFTDFYSRNDKERNLERPRRMPGFTLIEHDLADGPFFEDLIGRCDGGVFHLAGLPGVRTSWGLDFDRYVRDNVVVSQRVFEACLAQGRRCVYASSSSVYGDPHWYPTPEGVPLTPRSPYGVTKACVEQLHGAYMERGLEAVGLRYFTVYGPGQRPDMAIQRIVEALTDYPDEGHFEMFGDGGASRDFTFVSDAVAATRGVMECWSTCKGAVYNVGGGEEATLMTVIGMLEEIARQKLVVLRFPEAPGDVRRTCADTTRIREATRWRPKVGLVEGLRLQYEHDLAYVREIVERTGSGTA